MNENYISRSYGRSSIIVPVRGVGLDYKIEIDEYDNFILSNVSESWGDQISLYKSYNQWWIKSLGNKPSVRRFAGFIPDEYESEFQSKYLNLWRLSICLKNDRKVNIIYKNRAIDGYIVNLVIFHKKKSLPQFSFDFILVGKEILFKTIGDDLINRLDFNRNIDTDDAAMKAIIYKSTGIPNHTLPELYKEFILTTLDKNFVEKYRISDIGGRDFNIMSFGANPPLYHCTVLVSDYVDEDNSSWEYEFLNKLKNEWQLGNLVDNEILNLTYKSHVVSGYIIDVKGMTTTSRGMALTFDFMATAEDGLDYEKCGC